MTTIAPPSSVPALRCAGLAVTVLAGLPFAAIGAAGILFGVGAGSVVLAACAVAFLAASGIWPVVFWRVTRHARTAGDALSPLLPGLAVMAFAALQYALVGGP